MTIALLVFIVVDDVAVEATIPVFFRRVWLFGRCRGRDGRSRWRKGKGVSADGTVDHPGNDACQFIYGRHVDAEGVSAFARKILEILKSVGARISNEYRNQQYSCCFGRIGSLCRRSQVVTPQTTATCRWSAVADKDEHSIALLVGTVQLVMAVSNRGFDVCISTRRQILKGGKDCLGDAGGAQRDRRLVDACLECVGGKVGIGDFRFDGGNEVVTKLSNILRPSGKDVVQGPRLIQGYADTDLRSGLGTRRWRFGLRGIWNFKAVKRG
mmetsp:Transcript_61052/g.92300  ORF Transcript_61052/g.92300 Transcript_61052/m.92300 type:complete len:269 (+) Transcript_61052:234-1040(+)